MNLTVGHLSYRIRPVSEQLYFNRQPVVAICDHAAREILLQAHAEPDAARRALVECFRRICNTHADHLLDFTDRFTQEADAPVDAPRRISERSDTAEDHSRTTER